MNKDFILGYVKRPLLRLFRWAKGPAQGQGGLQPALALAYGMGGDNRGGDERSGRDDRRVRLFNFSEAGDEERSVSRHPGNGGAANRTAAEDSPSVNDLYKKYSPSLYWVCMRYTRSKEDAEDMVQQVFVKVQKNLEGFRGQSNVYTWMYRIAINECLHLFRKRKFEAEGNPEDLDHLVPVYPERELDAKLDLQRIMADTDPQTVEILFLLYMEGLTQEEVVETLGISRTTVNRKVAAFRASMGRFE